MSNIQKAQVKQNLPANYDEELAAEQAAMKARLGAAQGNVIRVKQDKTFEFPSGEKAEAISGVVLGFVSMNQFYEGRFDPKNIQPPVCVSIGTDIRAMVPFDNSPKMQNLDCYTCPKNQWGSDGKGKACKNQRVIALVPADAQADGPIMTIKTSPTASKYWDAYVREVMALSGALIKVVTRITCDPNSTYASLRFAVTGMNDGWQDSFGRRKVAMDSLQAEPDLGGGVAKAA